METPRSSTAVADRTVLDRLVQAGISRERAIEHVRGGWVLVDGRRVTDPDTPADPPVHVELRSIPRTPDR
ncbi:hypothetical protein [Pseudonocardia abyssalis]|uniref:RNA-binding S4 domain-containing protein n=1 Tax=Pseudonocardia abyssalis TaxID=2792008 RepID=A0ABS6UP97_9PSEU|nr:hypothetical protein [Pseudonocardia abyssalis]MBW0116579.1 hypothetical protein [Pseudonocardia abyssalis]MBW0133781.1 hypothetical protein [Pseudonocardia abyssalis]